MYTFFKTSFFFCLENNLFYPYFHETFFFALFCRKKKRWKMAIFDKNHGLTRLENFDIFDFFKTSFSMSTKHSFVSRISRNSLSCLILRKKKLSCLLPFPVVLWWELGLAFCTTEKHFEGSLSLRKNESKGKQHGWQAQYGLGWVYPLFVPMGKGWGYFSKICMGLGGLVCYTAVFSVVTQRFG